MSIDLSSEYRVSHESVIVDGIRPAATSLPWVLWQRLHLSDARTRWRILARYYTRKGAERGRESAIEDRRDKRFAARIGRQLLCPFGERASGTTAGG